MTIHRAMQLCVRGILLLLAVTTLSAQATVSTPAEVIGRLQATFLDVLKNADTLDYQARFDRLEPIVRECFDSKFMGKAVIGRQWKKLSEEDQNRWVDAFRKFTVANYANGLDHYSGQTFETLGFEAGNNETVTVRTHVVDPGKDPIELTYRLREIERGWCVIDIFARGTISELALRRSEYTGVLKQDGFEALIGLVNGKIAELAAGDPVS